MFFFPIVHFLSLQLGESCRRPVFACTLLDTDQYSGSEAAELQMARCEVYKRAYIKSLHIKSERSDTPLNTFPLFFFCSKKQKPAGNDKTRVSPCRTKKHLSTVAPQRTGCHSDDVKSDAYRSVVVPSVCTLLYCTYQTLLNSAGGVEQPAPPCFPLQSTDPL